MGKEPSFFVASEQSSIYPKMMMDICMVLPSPSTSALWTHHILILEMID